MKKIPPTHPGEILKEEFMNPYEISINQLARLLHVSTMRISQIVNEKRSITIDTALRLSMLFETSPEFWLHLQNKYDLETLKDKSISDIEEIKPFKVA